MAQTTDPDQRKPDRRSASRRWWAAGVAVLSVATVAGCSSGSGDDGQSFPVFVDEAAVPEAAVAEGDGATESEVVVVETDDEEAGTSGGPATSVDELSLDELSGAELEEFLARRYEGFWSAFDRARAEPSPDPATGHPQLADLATGTQLDAAHAELAELAASGRALREPDQPAVPGLDHEQSIRVRVDSIDGATAELSSCLVNDLVAYQRDDGTVISDQVVTVQATATMVLTDGTWKLLRSQAVGLETGVGGCWNEDPSTFPW